MAHLLSDAHWLNWLAKVFIQFVAPNIFTPQILLFFLLCFFFYVLLLLLSNHSFHVQVHFPTFLYCTMKAFQSWEIWYLALSVITSYCKLHPPSPFFFQIIHFLYDVSSFLLSKLVFENSFTLDQKLSSIVSPTNRLTYERSLYIL